MDPMASVSARVCIVVSSTIFALLQEDSPALRQPCLGVTPTQLEHMYADAADELLPRLGKSAMSE